MITDYDVAQYFRSPPRRIPISIIDDKQWLRIRNGRQIFRGMSNNEWKDVHPYGCERHLEVYTKHQAIAKYCFDCWKVLIAPRNVVELFKLLMIFEKIVLPIDNTRKCCVELRNKVSGTYKGIIFCRGLEEASEVLKIVQMAVSEDISPQVSVAIKRGCSEYEDIYPEFAKIELSHVIQYNEDWQRYEEAVDNDIVLKYGETDIHNINYDTTSRYNPREIYAMQFWLRYAATIGDASYIKIIGGTIRPIPNLIRPPFKNTAL